jgi:hypothetical protein
MPYCPAASQAAPVHPGTVPSVPDEPAGYEIRYCSLREPERALAFPCDRHGRVDLDALSTPLRNDYFFARALVGREFDLPAVRAC